MWKGKTVGVILPTYNEKNSIGQVVRGYFDTGFVDEVLVVNNNAVEGTDEAVRSTKARQVFESRQGYGYAIRRGFEEISSDLIVISEPDGTFLSRDLIKLLVYTDDYDVVWGTRTDERFIEKGANMGLLLRIGNIIFAKIMQFLYNTSRISDVGCTLKLYKREVIESIKHSFSVGKEHFGVELMVLTALKGVNIVEVPVSYHRRVGKSSVTGYPTKTVVLALKMLVLILSYYFKKV